MGAGGTGSSVSRRSSLSPLTSASWVTSKAGGRYEMLWHMMRQASPLGTRELVLFALLVKAYALVYTFSRVHHYTLWKFFAKLLWKNAATRPPVLIVLILLGWSWVVRTCTAAGMELELVLGGPTKPSSMAVSCALVLTNIFLSVHLVHLLASEVPGLTWRPWLTTNVLLHAVLALVIAAPHKWLHADARTSLLRAAWDSLIAPFAPVSFWHVIVADYATSLAKAFADVQLLFCEAHAIASLPEQPGAPYTRTTVLWEQMHPACVDSPFNPALLALPFWVRLCQCLHVYAHTKEQKNLWSAPRRGEAARRPAARAECARISSRTPPPRPPCLAPPPPLCVGTRSSIRRRSRSSTSAGTGACTRRRSPRASSSSRRCSTRATRLCGTC